MLDPGLYVPANDPFAGLHPRRTTYVTKLRGWQTWVTPSSCVCCGRCSPITRYHRRSGLRRKSQTGRWNSPLPASIPTGTGPAPLRWSASQPRGFRACGWPTVPHADHRSSKSMNCGQPLSSVNRSNPRLSPVSGATRWHPEPGGSLVSGSRGTSYLYQSDSSLAAPVAMIGQLQDLVEELGNGGVVLLRRFPVHVVRCTVDDGQAAARDELVQMCRRRNGAVDAPDDDQHR